MTKKRKSEASKASKFYHNMTSEYNGYFNANELVEFALLDLRAANTDNYTQIIELYDYISVPDPKMVNADMDKAIEKVTRVAALHDIGDWVDDCYVLMGRAQYIKQDYETAIETFEYFQEDFNPANPYGRNFQKKKISAKDRNKERKKQRKAEAKAKEKARKELEEQRKREKAEREKNRKNRGKRGSRTRTAKPNPEDTTASAQETKTAEPVQTVPPPSSASRVKDPVDKSAYSEGLVWLAMSYIRAGKYTSAEFLLNRLSEKSGMQEEWTLAIAVARADLLIKTGKPYQALEFLDQAIALDPPKKDLARYAFVAGQILMNEGQYRDASDYFETARKKSRDYKMKFMAELNGIKCSQLQGGRSRSEVAGKLEGLLKEEKYAEFQDQIYFALGEIALNEGKIDEACDHFSKCVGTGSKDKSLQSEAYYQMAEIYYNRENFVQAKTYYDSTLMVMAKTDVRYKTASNFAQNLTEIAKNISTITRLDSTLAMADLPEDQLREIARKRLEDEKARGIKRKVQTVDKNLILNSGNRKSVISDFWAYNIQDVEAGKRTFSEKWGDRPLVDNWRLSSRINSSSFQDEKPQEVAEAPKEIEKDELTREEFERLTADIPKTPLEKGKMEEEIRKAQFALGKQYRDKLQKYQKSIITLESLNERFGNHIDIIESLFYLYLNYVDIGATAQAEGAKNKIIQDFPESKYAQILANPEYASNIEDERKKLDRYYEQTYSLFSKGEYEKVAERVRLASENFGKDNRLMPKFSLLNAMALGYTQGQKAYLEALNEVVVRYPNTPEESKAREIMRFLKGDKTAFNGVDVQAIDQMFAIDDESRHYIAVILFDQSDDVLQRSKIAVSEYNKQFFSKDRLQLGELILSLTEGTQLILVRAFSNKEKAMNYYKEVQKNKDAYIPTSMVNYDVLPISQQNYRKMQQQQTHTNYRVFFEKNYLQE